MIDRQHGSQKHTLNATRCFTEDRKQVEAVSVGRLARALWLQTLTLVWGIEKWSCLLFCRVELWRCLDTARQCLGEWEVKKISRWIIGFLGNISYTFAVYYMFSYLPPPSFNPHSDPRKQGALLSLHHRWGNWEFRIGSQVGLLPKAHDLNCKLNC